MIFRLVLIHFITVGAKIHKKSRPTKSDGHFIKQFFTFSYFSSARYLMVRTI